MCVWLASLLGGPARLGLISTHMRDVPGTLRGGHGSFDTTHWSVVFACARGEGDPAGGAPAALTRLCQDYWPPLYSFARRRGYQAPDAQDLTQDFFAYLLETRVFHRADPARGKFRSFLLTLFKRFLANANTRERQQKRGGGQEFVLLDEEIQAVEAQSSRTPELAAMDEDRYYEQRWAEALVARTFDFLRRENAAGTKGKIFGALEPFLRGGHGLPSQQEVAARLDIPLGTLRSHLSRLRARYREVIRAEVSRTVAATEDVDEELRYLFRALVART